MWLPVRCVSIEPTSDAGGRRGPERLSATRDFDTKRGCYQIEDAAGSSKVNAEGGSGTSLLVWQRRVFFINTQLQLGVEEESQQPTLNRFNGLMAMRVSC